jgi:hypothetical protein
MFGVLRPPYKLPDGTFLVPSGSQADMLFMLMVLADEYIKTAQLMVEYDVFLECGMAAIVEMLQITANATVAIRDLCTSFASGVRNLVSVIDSCLNTTEASYIMYHPYKLSSGLDAWGQRFGRLIEHGSTASREQQGENQKLNPRLKPISRSW